MVRYSKIMAARDTQVEEKQRAKEAMIAADRAAAANMEAARAVAVAEAEERERARAIAHRNGELVILDQLAERAAARAAADTARRAEGEQMKARIVQLKEEEVEVRERWCWAREGGLGS